MAWTEGCGGPVFPGPGSRDPLHVGSRISQVERVLPARARGQKVTLSCRDLFILHAEGP